jgi:hypothetical protein
LMKFAQAKVVFVCDYIAIVENIPSWFV